MAESSYQLADLLDQALAYCASVSYNLQEDVCCVPTETCTDESSSKSTVGLMLKGLRVDNIVIGGPCGELKKGDFIEAVNGEKVNEENLHTLLKGDDTPGSIITITVKRVLDGSPRRLNFKIARMASSTIADRRRMFELFTDIKVRAEGKQDQTTSETVDQCIELWTGMLVADAVHDQAIVENVAMLQNECLSSMNDLKECLESIEQEAQRLGIITSQREGKTDFARTPTRMASSRTLISSVKLDEALLISSNLKSRIERLFPEATTASTSEEQFVSALHSTQGRDGPQGTTIFETPPANKKFEGKVDPLVALVQDLEILANLVNSVPVVTPSDSKCEALQKQIAKFQDELEETSRKAQGRELSEGNRERAQLPEASEDSPGKGNLVSEIDILELPWDGRTIYVV